jgi:fructokinase
MTEPDVLVAGETLVDFLPDEPGPLADVERFARRAGGAPANVAVALSKLHDPPWLWTRVGADPFGDHLVETLDAHGIPERFVERDSNAKTTLAFVSHDEDADREFTFYRDDTADTRMQPGSVPDEALESVEWVHVGGVMLASEPSRSATLDLADRARDAGCTVSFDPNARPELWPDAGEFERAVGRALELADVVKATPGELRLAGFEGDPEGLAARVSDAGPHTVLLTLGRSGALAATTASAPWEPTCARHPGYGVEAIDATGAGDAFTAGSIVAMSNGRESLADVLAFSNAVAALATTAPGAMAALPDRERVEMFRAGRAQ